MLLIPALMVAAWDAVVLSLSQDGDKEQARAVVAQLSVVAICLHATNGILGFVSGTSMGLAGEKIVARLRVRLYRHILSQEIGWFDGQKSGDLVSRLGSDALLVQQATTHTLQEVTLGILNFVFAITAMFIVSWQLALTIFGTIMVYFLFVGRPIMSRIAKLTRRSQEALGGAANASTETIGSMRTVSSCASEGIEHLRYAGFIGDASPCLPRRGNTTLYTGTLKHVFGAALGNGFFSTIFVAVSVATWVGLNLITYGQLTVRKLGLEP